MVVLEGHGTNPQMLSGTNGGPNQYLQPDYMSPLPTMLDAKKSPLALLVQTCSQIGADSSSSKFESSSSSQNNKRKHSINIESLNSSSSSNRLNDFDNLSNGRPRSSGSHSNSSSTSSNSSFHSKSTVIIANNGSQNGKTSPGGGQRHKSTDSNNSNNSSGGQRSLKRATSSTSSIRTSPIPSKIQRVSPPVSSSSSSTSSEKDLISVVTNKRSSSKSPCVVEKSTKSSPSSSNSSGEDEKLKPSQSDPQGSNPIIRSGLEILNGPMRSHHHSGGIPMPSSLSALSGYPPTSTAGMFAHEAFLNPAFRLPFFPSQSHMFMGGYPGGGQPQPAGSSPYVSYSRVKNPSGAESIVPVCKDPYCTGCQFSPGGSGGIPGYPSSNSSQGICPAGCAQCDHQKIPYHQAFGLGMGYPQALLSQHAALLQHHQLQQQQQHAAVAAAQHQHQQQVQQQHQQQNAQRPYVCNWIVGDNYCGKRFPNSEDLLQHLRTHTSSSSSPGGSADAAALAALAAHQQQQLYSSALGLNPAAMAAAMQRAYPNSNNPGQLSPYGKLPQGYYPPPGPYSLYGQRVGPSVLP